MEEEKIKEHIQKKKDPLPGEPGHWRYEKDKKVGSNKATGTDTKGIGLKEKPEAKEKIPDDRTLIFTKSEAKALDRADQETILNNRGVKFSSKDKNLL